MILSFTHLLNQVGPEETALQSPVRLNLDQTLSSRIILRMLSIDLVKQNSTILVTIIHTYI